MRVIDHHGDHPIERLLGYEGLSNEERTPVDAHLAVCEACRSLRSGIFEAEASPAALESIPYDPGNLTTDPLSGLDAATRADAAESKAALLAALRSAGRSGRSRRRWIVPAVIVVAVLAAVYLLRP